MSMTTISDPRHKSSGLSSKKDSSHSKKRKNSAPRSISDPTSPTKTSLQPPSPSKKWRRSYLSSQASSRLQCSRVHYHQWCEDCLTQTEWEQPPLISPTRKTPIPTFGELRTATREKSLYQSRFATQTVEHKLIQKICSRWRDEQFAKAVAKRSAVLAAREAVRRSLRQ